MSSFPSIIFGRYGDEKVAQSTTFGPPLGARMILPDGREFVHVLAGTVLSIGVPVVGKLLAGLAGSTVNLAVPTDRAIGATILTITMPAGTTVASVVDQYAGGYLSVSDSTGAGYVYKIKSSGTAAAASTATFTLEPSDPLKVALANGSSTVSLRENGFYKVLDRGAGTGTVNIPAGVPQIAVSAGFYCWLQRRGEATLLSAGTIVETGRPFACATTVAGFQAWDPILAAGSAGAGTVLSPVGEAWGHCMLAPSASTKYFTGYLELA